MKGRTQKVSGHTREGRKIDPYFRTKDNEPTTRQALSKIRKSFWG